MGFPPCQECAELDRRVSSRQGLIQLLALLVSVGICCIVAFVGRGDHGSMVQGFLVGIVLFALVATIAHMFRRAGLTPDQRQWSKLVDAVRIRGFTRLGLQIRRAGEIAFQFGDEAFAEEFAQRNLGWMA